MSKMLNRPLAIGTLVIMVAVIIVVAVVLWRQDNNDQPVALGANSFDSQPGLDPRVVRQIPMSNAADQIDRLRRADGLQGFTGMRIDNNKDELILYWKGENLPPEMSSLVDEIRAKVSMQVVNSPYSLEELEGEARRLIQLPPRNGVDVIESRPDHGFLRHQSRN